MSKERYPGLKKDLQQVLAKHGLKLYEDDGMWCLLDSNYDRLAFTTYPFNTNPGHLPPEGKYVGPTVGGIG